MHRSETRIVRFATCIRRVIQNTIHRRFLISTRAKENIAHRSSFFLPQLDQLLLDFLRSSLINGVKVQTYSRYNHNTTRHGAHQDF